MLNNRAYLLLIAVGLMLSCSSERPKLSKDDGLQVEVNVTTDEDLGSHLITAYIPRRLPRFGLRDTDGNMIPTQIDRIDQLTNQLTFLTNIPVGEKTVLTGLTGEESSMSAAGVSVDFRSYEDLEIVDWNSLQPMVKNDGIIISNDWIGYHIGLDHVRLTPLLIQEGLRADVEASMLVNGDHCGLAGLGLYNFDGIVPLTDFERAEAEIIAEGPLRAVVRIRLTGIPVRKDKVSVQLDYTVYAEKPYVDLDFTITSKTNLELKLAIGLPRHDAAPHFTMGKKDNCHFAYTYGPQSREGLFLGNVFFITDSYETDIFNEDEVNHYMLIDPVENGLKARAMSLHSSDQLAISDESSFIEQVRKTASTYGSPAIVEVIEGS